jgi:hypothetical protein
LSVDDAQPPRRHQQRPGGVAVQKPEKRAIACGQRAQRVVAGHQRHGDEQRAAVGHQTRKQVLRL